MNTLQINSALMPNVEKYKNTHVFKHHKGVMLNPSSPEVISSEIFDLVVYDVEKACMPLTAESSINWTQLLSGSFPVNNAVDPETYSVFLQKVICKYPEDIVEQTVYEIITEEEWLPAIAKVSKKLDKKLQERMEIGINAQTCRISQENLIDKWKQYHTIENLEQTIRVNKSNIERSKHDQYPKFLNIYKKRLEEAEAGLAFMKKED